MHTTSGSMASLHGRRLQRRFEHSLLALFAVAFCAGLILLAARPLPPAPVLAAQPGAERSLSALTGPAATATANAASPQPQRKRTHVRRSHQTLAMPYFSFAAGN